MVHIPDGATICRVMGGVGPIHKSRHKPDGITKADKETRKPDDIMKHGFTAGKPAGKCVAGMMEIKASDGKTYVPAIFDRYDLAVNSPVRDTMSYYLMPQPADFRLPNG